MLEKWTGDTFLQKREGCMEQLHRRLTDEQVKVLLRGYRQGILHRATVEEVWGIGRSRFFALLKE